MAALNRQPQQLRRPKGRCRVELVERIVSGVRESVVGFFAALQEAQL
jgi:hypothetical protein